MGRALQPIDVQVGLRIRVRRLTFGMSQTDLADALGLTFQQIQKYEKGVNRVSASRLQQMSRVLRVPISYFFDETPSGAARSSAHPPHVEAILTSRMGHALIRSFSQIKRRTVRRKIVELVETLAASRL